ncbi:hypothetical protein C9J12_21140 [Photobacterium frigidiphilum]|uniref:Uncharacterized protein n=1 Tax=Photobacterium frigidiphilum TaxID=264736 RepID=A0A2T3JA76_9GAMM|nr:hypothetical protein [Photobacterium frigidiphilum]PSU45750.1 hypothetical protein C9J12_21140 [Photobacterium frigidiphilum]
MTTSTLSRILPTNAAGEQMPTMHEIIPGDGQPIIKLFGWLRSFADYDLGPSPKDSTHITQEIFESNDGWWLVFEVRRERNVALDNRVQCRLLKTQNKDEIPAFFNLYRTHARALLAQIDMAYVVHIGGDE